MIRSNLIFLFLELSFFLFLCSCSHEEPAVALKPGMIITRSMTIRPQEYAFNASTRLKEPLILIKGNNITLDFQGATLRGSNDRKWPDEFYGLAIRVENSFNVEIKNLNVHGYKVGLLAENVDSLQLSDADFSYNYRQRLKSTREEEDLSDWMSFHNNEEDQWLRYGAAIYLKRCNKATVRDVRVTGGQNGLMMSRCNDGLFYNNTIHFNSAVGIGLYRCSRNRIMHNRLDWNVRGYSHGFYSQGQNSAGILCYEQSSDNIFAYNSATHSGDGFFLWAGQSTTDSGEGGCNDNIVYKNDFSYSPANAVEVTFSKNQVVDNKLNNSTYGIWGGYSHNSLFANNEIESNEVGIAVERGQDNDILNNHLAENETGIHLWERPQQPEEREFARSKEVSSRNYQIESNLFKNTSIPLRIDHTAHVRIENNHFQDFDRLLRSEESTSQDARWINNTVYQARGWEGIDQFLNLNTLKGPEEWPVETGRLDYPNTITPLPDGMDVRLPAGHLQGRAYILVDEWGPYDFRYPAAWLRDVDEEAFVFLLLGPEGNWALSGAEGFEQVRPKTGTFPATVIARRESGASGLSLSFKFVGQAVTDQFGRSYKKGQSVPFTFIR